MLQQLITQYLDQLHNTQTTGAAQPEQSYCPALQTFLEKAAATLGYDNVQVISQPQHDDYGAPDFQVQQEHTIIGWIEGKRLGGGLNHKTRQPSFWRKFGFLITISGGIAHDRLVTTTYENLARTQSHAASMGS